MSAVELGAGLCIVLENCVLLEEMLCCRMGIDAGCNMENVYIWMMPQ